MHPRPQLTLAEKEFLQAWMWEEAHAQDSGTGMAKRHQVENNPFAVPLLADIAVATMSADEQVAVVNGPKPTGNPSWPWASDDELRARHREAKAWLENSRFAQKLAST
jgi:hypothetical protein